MAEFAPAARVSALPGNFFVDMNRRIGAARAAGADVIDLSRGNPDLPTPPHIVEAMQAAVADPATHGYPSYRAIPQLADAIAHRYREDHGVEVDPDEHIAIFHGSNEAFLAAVLALVDPGETLVVPDPGYPEYRSAASLAGAEVRTTRLDPARGHAPDARTIDADDAAVLMLNYPHNPTGAAATRETFDVALETADGLGAAFVHDFAYGSIGFTGRPISALTADREFARTVELSTLSKTYSMAGWRIGYAVGNASAIAAMRAYQESAFSSIFAATQAAAAAALSGSQAAADELVDVYRRRRDLVVDGLTRAGWRVFPAEGAFFVWFEVAGDDVAFATRLLQEHGVALAPGSGFGPAGAGHVRISLVHDEETLLRALERLPSP